MVSHRSEVRIEEIAFEHAGRRIDNYLVSRLKHTPKSLIYKLLRSGQVRVNGGRVKPDYRLVARDVVRIPPLAEDTSGDPTVPLARLAQLEAMILHECADFLILNKPAGLASHGGSGLRYGVIEAARALRPQAARLDLAHRLDRDTSGCLVLTKHLSALRRFHEQLRRQRVVKRYQALLRGRVPPALSRIEAALAPARSEGGERRMAIADDGRQSATLIENRVACGPHSLVQLRLVTGRMHQIRAHARHIGHPVAGDRHYGEPSFNAEMLGHGLNRLFLHACHIEFDSGAGMLVVDAPLPIELAAVVTKLRTPA